MKRSENELLMQIGSNVAVLTARHEENFRDIKEIKEILAKMNGRMRDTEQRSIKNETKLGAIKWVVGIIAGSIAAATNLLIKFMF